MTDRRVQGNSGRSNERMMAERPLINAPNYRPELSTRHARVLIDDVQRLQRVVYRDKQIQILGVSTDNAGNGNTNDVSVPVK